MPHRLPSPSSPMCRGESTTTVTASSAKTRPSARGAEVPESLANVRFREAFAGIVREAPPSRFAHSRDLSQRCRPWVSCGLWQRSSQCVVLGYCQPAVGSLVDAHLNEGWRWHVVVRAIPHYSHLVDSSG